MLLTVFGMLSGNGNKRQRKNTGVTHPGKFLYALTTASKRESIVLNRWQVSWLVTLVPSFSSRYTGAMDMVELRHQPLNVTYSCATARDLHTVPF
jgi:hypothetical protein